jgi:hypothetical protein
MTEAISLFFFSLVLHRSFLYLKRRRAFDLVLVQVLSILLIGFRMSYLALVVILSVALPIIGFVPLVLANHSRTSLIVGKSPTRISRTVQKFMVHLVVSVVAMMVLHQAYKSANGFLSHREPDYLYGTGFHLLSFWAPAVQPEDSTDRRLAQLIREGDQFQIRDVDARPCQRFCSGYLVDRWCRIETDVQKANLIAKQTALRTLEHHPIQVALLAWKSYAGYWSIKAIKHYARLDLQMGTLRQEEVVELATRFHHAVTSPNLATEPVTFTKWYYVAAHGYYFVVLLLPLISLAVFLPVIAKRYACFLFLTSAVQFSSTFFLTTAPVVRYLQPLSLLTILSFAAISKVLIDRSSTMPNA